MRAFSSPMWRRCLRNVARTIWLKRVQQTTITGTTANTMSVSHTFMPARMMNEITPFSPAMKKFFRTVVGEFRYIKQVVGDAPHDLAHLGIGKVAVGQLLQVVKRRLGAYPFQCARPSHGPCWP